MSLEKKEVSRIIKTCANLGVKHFKWGDFEIDFHPKNANLEENPNEIVKKLPDNPKKREEIERESIAKDEKRLKDDEIANLILADPSTYEQLELSGELIDGKADDREA